MPENKENEENLRNCRELILAEITNSTPDTPAERFLRETTSALCTDVFCAYDDGIKQDIPLRQVVVALASALSVASYLALRLVKVEGVDKEATIDFFVSMLHAQLQKMGITADGESKDVEEHADNKVSADPDAVEGDLHGKKNPDVGVSDAAPSNIV